MWYHGDPSTSKTFGIIGDPVSHSLSPLLHNAAYQVLGLKHQYGLFPVTANNLQAAVAGIRALGIGGVSVTIPHKTTIIPFLDELDPLARQVGAVNTVVNDGGILRGYNTDCKGIINPLAELFNLKKERVVLLGNGGAARAAAFALKAAGVKKLTILARSPESAQRLIDEVGGGEVGDINGNSVITGHAILINATSVGMEPKNPGMPVALERFFKLQCVFDMVYTPRDTELLKAASGRGIQTIGGLEMLLEQGVEQFNLFTGQALSVETFRQPLADLS